MTAPQEPMLVWERPEPPSRPAPSPLSRERIVRAAIDLADRDGLDAVSLRKVAAALDAGPMRLYGYLSTKEELLDLMVDEVYGEIVPSGSAGPAGPSGDDWRAALTELARRTREAALRHEWFADLLGSRPRLGPNALAYLEASLACLGDTAVGTVVRVVSTVNAYVLGAVRREVTELRAERATGMDEQAYQAARGPYLARMLATGRYPAVARFVEGEDVDPDFDEGLEYVLDGVAPLVSGGR
ncbi:TetR/AcrR family transcriptional regulator [Nonomuraea sp. NPDC050786]|uniref:TetR/AcrR family transcriptional regulator n=1 Tax=Nonomuraea sp. NPDC050786 TaxID=3154840 RepID=UPI0034105BC9